MGKSRKEPVNDEEIFDKELGPAIGRVIKRHRIEKRSEIRKKGHWTQADLAERAKITDKHIQKLESGKTKRPFYETVAAIINALDLDYEQFQQEVREEKAKYIAKENKNEQEPGRK